ncbi:MAG: ABC transporter permease [Vicinamibacteria bacterium]
MNALIQDLRYGLRTLARSPWFTAAAVLSLALGIGANTAIFSVVNGVLLHSLPYQNEDEVVMLWEDATTRGGTNRVPASPGNFLSWREANPAFTDLAAIFNNSLRVSLRDEPLVPLTHQITSNYFDLLGVRPLLGRVFTPEEEHAGADRVVIISYPLWQRILGGGEGVIGETMSLDDEPYTVVGVMPQDFVSVHIFAVQPDLWIPLVLDGQENQRSTRGLAVYGRLRPGTSLSQAQAGMNTVAARLAADFPATNTDWGVRIVPIRDEVIGGIRPTLLVLLAAVGFVLLIACANVANLTLAKASERSREISLRTALGASRLRLARQLLTESVLLAGLGGAIGVARAAWGLRPLLQIVPPGAVPFLGHVGVDPTVLLVTVGVSLLTGIAFGLAPARQAGKVDLIDSLKQGGRSPAFSRGARRFGNAVVVAEVALALVLMAGAGLMIQSFRNLKSFDAGFDIEPILVLRNSLRGESFAEPHQRISHFEELARRLDSLPGVESVSGVSFHPPLLPFQATFFSVPGQPVEPGHEPVATSRAVLPDYFETMGIRLLKGRVLGEGDLENSAPVVVINEVLARRYFQDRDPVGDYLVVERAPAPEIEFEVPRQIVGVVGNVRSTGANPESLPVIYYPHTQTPFSIMTMVMRVAGDPTGLARAAEREAWGMGGDINVYSVETMAERVNRIDFGSQISTLLLAVFAFLAVALGAAGIYAVISYTVANRTHEFGVRMALGASRRDVLGLVLGGGLKLAAVGVVAGLAASLGLGRLLSSLLYGVETRDVTTLASVAAILLGIAVLASLVPAYRASRVDPIVALRDE